MKRLMKSLCSLSLAIILMCDTLTVSAGNIDIVSTTNHTYTYAEMQEDILLLVQNHPDKLTLSTVGTSVDGRPIYQIILGNKNAKNAIYVQSTVHGREWMNSWIMMEQLELCCNNWNTISPHGITYKDIFNNCCIYLLPMVNPDSVVISQLGFNGINDAVIRSNCKAMPGANNPSKWKANAHGVDLNRQFSVGWNTRVDTLIPSSENYNGTAPFTEPEAVAMKNAMAQREFVAGVTYHSMEGAIYWDLNQNEDIRNKALVLATHCSNITGYKLGGLSACKGLEYNYMNYAENTPMVCIETGTVQCPLPYNQFKPLLRQNGMMFVMLAGCYQ